MRTTRTRHVVRRAARARPGARGRRPAVHHARRRARPAPPRSARRRGRPSTSSAVNSTAGSWRSAGALGEVGRVVRDQRGACRPPAARRRRAVRRSAARRRAAAGRPAAPGRRAPRRPRRSSASACTQSTCRSRPRACRSWRARPLSRPDQGEVDGGDLPAALGQPERVAPLAGGQVDRPARRQPGQLRGDELVGRRRPDQLGWRRTARPRRVRPWAEASPAQLPSGEAPFCCAATAACTSAMSRPRTAPISSSSACGGQRAGLGVDQHALAEGHQRRDRGDVRGAGRALLGLGVDLGEHDVVVRLGRLLEGRARTGGRVRTTRPRSRRGRCRCRRRSSRMPVAVSWVVATV